MRLLLVARLDFNYNAAPQVGLVAITNSQPVNRPPFTERKIRAMRRHITTLTLICMLLVNGVTSQARKTHLKQTKSRTERKAPKSSAPQKQVARRQRESAKEKAAQRQLIKPNPRVAGLLKS
jgi:hypothetical protein